MLQLLFSMQPSVSHGGGCSESPPTAHDHTDRQPDRTEDGTFSGLLATAVSNSASPPLAPWSVFREYSHPGTATHSPPHEARVDRERRQGRRRQRG